MSIITVQGTTFSLSDVIAIQTPQESDWQEWDAADIVIWLRDRKDPVTLQWLKISEAQRLIVDVHSELMSRKVERLLVSKVSGLTLKDGDVLMLQATQQDNVPGPQYAKIIERFRDNLSNYLGFPVVVLPPFIEPAGLPSDEK